MKILHSYWSLPGLTRESNRFSGGWYHRRYHYMSWALSCLQFRRFYDRVELVTDSFGKHILYDLLQLPYTNVRTDLDALQHFPTDLWAMGKLRAYQLQTEPFIHADGDVYLFQPLGDRLEKAPVVAQHLEIDYPYYKSILRQVQTHFSYIPPFVREDWQKRGNLANAYNAGIIGGNDLSFLQRYVSEVIAFVENNKAHFSHVYLQELNILYEQYLLFCLADAENMSVQTYFEHISFRQEGLTDFSGVPCRTPYIHPVASFKKNRKNCEQIAYRLRRDYPEHYYRINYLLQHHQL